MTKTFTAATVLRLRDDGVLALDDGLPELATAGPTADSPAITLRHLLSMQSGLTSDDRWADRHLDIGTDELDAVVAAGPMFAFPPGTGYEYSNLGYGVIGRVDRAGHRRAAAGRHRPPADPSARARADDVDPAGPRRLGPALPRRGRSAGGGRSAARRRCPRRRWAGCGRRSRTSSGVMACFDDAFPARDGDDDGPLRRASRREQQQVQRAVDGRPQPRRRAKGSTTSRNGSTAAATGSGCR